MVFDEILHQRISGNIRHNHHPHTPQLIFLVALRQFNPNNQNAFVFCRTSPALTIMLLTTNVAFVHFNRAGQFASVWVDHRLSNFLKPCPRRRVAFQPKNPLQTHRARPGLLRRYPPYCGEPFFQGFPRVLKDSPCYDGRLMPAILARVQRTPYRPRVIGLAALWADKPLGPS